MNAFLLSANLLCFLAFLAHTFQGDRELQLIHPKTGDSAKALETWVMVRCGWHWISLDLLLATVALALINFTDYFEQPQLLLQIAAFYFAAYGVVWIITLLISKPFPGRFWRLGQWGLLWLISGLIYFGM